jgi:hypothetical protein
MGVPTQGEAYSKLMEHLRLAQEEAATLAHLASANDDRKLAQGWLLVSENFKKMQHSVTTLAMRRMQ